MVPKFGQVRQGAQASLRQSGLSGPHPSPSSLPRKSLWGSSRQSRWLPVSLPGSMAGQLVGRRAVPGR